MRVRLDKPWRDLSEAEVARLGGELGVYEIADEAGEVIYVGYAGGRATFGLRGELRRRLALGGAGRRFRCEVNMQYLSRWNELLAVHLTDHGRLPREQEPDLPLRLGRVDPATRPR